MRRRAFIMLLGGAAAWPFAARAQQERMRRIGVLVNFAADDPLGQARHGAFLQGLQQAGWTIGRNVQVETRWGPGDADRLRTYAAELAALAPDVILATGNAGVAPMLQATRSVPIVFVIVPDPVGAGFVDSLARPGGNATGFTSFEYGLSAKWLELLKEIAPAVTRAGVIRDPALASGRAQFAAIQSMAPSLGVAARHKLPAVYPEGAFIRDGGLISYGPDFLDQYRRAAGYVDRILKGEKPADLPIQTPTNYELVINLKTAKALGLEIPPSSRAPTR